MPTGRRRGSGQRVTTPDGVDISYRVSAGGSEAPVILIAGTGYAGATWPADVVASLGRDRPVVTFDHRGTGSSGSSEAMYSTRLFAADTAAILDDARLGAVHVIGHSMGGRVAQWLAIDRPDLVSSLVLAASGAGQPGGRGSGPPSVPYRTAIGIARDGYRNHLRDQIETTFFTPEFAAVNPVAVIDLAEAFWRSRPTLSDYLKHVVARQQHYTLDMLDRIRRPTLVVVGARDTHVGGTGSHWDQSRLLAERIAGAAFREVEGVAHGLFWQFPERTLAILREWLER